SDVCSSDLFQFRLNLVCMRTIVFRFQDHIPFNQLRLFCTIHAKESNCSSSYSITRGCPGQFASFVEVSSTQNLLGIRRVGEPMNNARFTTFRRRSEEHTSELQSRENLVCRLLLEKKKIQSN